MSPRRVGKAYEVTLDVVNTAFLGVSHWLDYWRTPERAWAAYVALKDHLVDARGEHIDPYDHDLWPLDGSEPWETESGERVPFDPARRSETV